MIDRTWMRWVVVAMLAGCWVVGGCGTTAKVRHSEEARTARAAGMRRKFEKDIHLLELRGKSGRDKMTWARMQIDLRLDPSRYEGYSADEMAFATEPLFKRYLKQLKKLSKKAAKSGEDRASFALERELVHYRFLRRERIVRVEKTALAPVVAQIDAVCEEADARLREEMAFPGGADE